MNAQQVVPVARRSFPASRRDQGLTLTEALAITAVVVVLVLLSGFLVPTIVSYRREALKVQCAGNLKELGKLASMYADSAGMSGFPFAGGDRPAAHESLNVLVRLHGGGRKVPPDVFVCPTWRERELAEVDEENRYELDASTNSYTWTARRLTPRDAGYPLASDKYCERSSPGQKSGHRGGMNVLYTDMSVSWMPRAKLQVSANELPTGLTR